MFWNRTKATALVAAALAGVFAAQAQERRPRIDVEHYEIKAEISPRTQSLAATAEVRFVALEDNVGSVVFELNNALNVSSVVDGEGRPVSATRSQQDFTVRASLPAPLAKGAAARLVFKYDGRLSGAEDSPVYGLKFAAIQNDFAFLMYPARWFPVNDYTADRYTAGIAVTVPDGFQALGAGQFTQPSFPGSIAMVRGEPALFGGAKLYFRGEQASMAQAYGEEMGKVLAHLTSLYGLPPTASLSVVETEAGTPNGYSAPGLLFLSPKGIGQQVNARLLANQLARQWWMVLLSPKTRNDLWIANGFARYSEMLYLEQANGPGALESEVRDAYIEALTVDDPPLGQAGRLEDYSPEYWALTAGKGAAVVHMLRYVVGDEVFHKLIKAVPDKFAWKPVSTDDFRLVADAVSGQKLDYFFLQWVNSTGAPEFKLEYTVFRTQKGFRVNGKVSQDLDLFRMPVDLKIETEGNPEEKRVEVSGTSSEFVVETFGKPRSLTIDPAGRVLRYSDPVRVAVAIRRGEQFAELGEFGDSLKEYQRALEVNRNSSLAHYRVAEVFFLQNNYQSAANEFREVLNGDLEPKWTEVWARINLGKIFDITGQRERAVNEYNLAIRTKDNTQGAQEEAAKYLKEPFERKTR
ncbi:MAG: peptidase M1 [Acidobacteria bacterium]|nr:peptidase M1 [Acidobacteriota bacterium]